MRGNDPTERFLGVNAILRAAELLSRAPGDAWRCPHQGQRKPSPLHTDEEDHAYGVHFQTPGPVDHERCSSQ